MNETLALEAFRARSRATLEADHRIESLLEAGAGGEGRADRYSDIDFVLVAHDDAYGDLLAGRLSLAEGLGSLLAAFTGEHVGEPRLLICLYAVPDGDRVLHVDLKVIRRADLAHRVDDPCVLFDRDGAAAAVLGETEAHWPERPPQWFEDRIWVWLHYGAARAARGELFEALDMLAFLRSHVLGPMLATSAGLKQRGLRHVEAIPGAAEALAATLAGPDKADVRAALLRGADLYLRLRESRPPPVVRSAAEQAVRAYIGAVLS